MLIQLIMNLSRYNNVVQNCNRLQCLFKGVEATRCATRNCIVQHEKIQPVMLLYFFYIGVRYIVRETMEF